MIKGLTVVDVLTEVDVIKRNSRVYYEMMTLIVPLVGISCEFAICCFFTG